MNILIVEDEAQIAKHLKKLIYETLGQKVSYLNIRYNIEDAISMLNSRKIDVLLLDLNLNGRDGFEILKNLVGLDIYTIIVSAYADKAIEAFEFGVTDFIPKPFNRSRLKKTFDRISNIEKNKLHFAKILAVRKRGKFKMIAANEVVYIQGAGQYSEVYLENGNKDLSDKSLDKLYMILPENFERVHRSYIVNMTHVKSIHFQSGSKYEVQLHNGNFLPIGRTKYKAIKEKWL